MCVCVLCGGWGGVRGVFILCMVLLANRPSCKKVCKVCLCVFVCVYVCVLCVLGVCVFVYVGGGGSGGGG